MTTTTAPTRSASFNPRKLLHAREAGVFAALVLLFILGVVLQPNFAQSGNLLSVGQQISQIGIMAIGATFVIINGEIDLSVGSIYALSAITTGMAITAGVAWPLAILIGLLVAVAAGILNGLAVVLLGVPSFIVTLGSLSVFRGITLLISDGAPISLSSDQPGVAEFTLIGQGRLFGVVPMQLIIFAVIAAIGIVLLSRSRLGFNTYAVGGNQEAARLVGINVKRVKLTAFVLSGLTAGISGVLGLSFLSYVQGVTGTGLELTVISAVIIGGAALFGGSGTMWGTIIGVLFIGLLQNILNINGISSFWQTVVTGLVIVAAVAADTWQRRRKTKA
ncbi:monosaccharide-transporting ATPase [Cnuibacter physcomitrellae]|uniref:Autoinducer 2 import system permease protein LsrD n=1 Tax=Cnuibacter physcomitrellae TaxID=1619308 RepID=A0A1X9LRP5_9MICO|nr:ABC transporter permease [Cnuibacter physcomitrellae]ARJ06611.1 ABC transporter permease [Cnuibacter physcomitrellae]MCS5498048.1 ABC transporter permease [Cnuibacter physcomitrellae]GGI38417.1 monosaccharide-transporting ATPase [Cnuibacter physcomitrellae]